MVATPNSNCRPEVLAELLDDQLSPADAEQVQSHLDSCQVCRQQLDSIAGQASWWEETVSVLTENTRVESAPVTTTVRPSLDASLSWIQPLLQPGSADELGRIGHYPIHDIIGQGGMGVVLRGTDPELGRPIAVKILSPHLAGVGAARNRFLREARAVAAVVHPSIVPIYSPATTGQRPYTVMPYIAGGNLQQQVDRDGPLDLTSILQIALQVAEGLAAAHQHGVIHRDIKPANILIEEGNGRALISDFGLARALNDATLTMSGMISGTPSFMSPEQAEGQVVDHRSDLFSLGSLIYTLATGRPPFRAENPLAVLRKISESPPEPIRRSNELMPAWLEQLVGRLMQKDRSRRLETADAAARLLRDSLAHVRNPLSSPLPAEIAKPQPKSRNPIVVLTLAVAMTTLLVCLLAAFTNRNAADHRNDTAVKDTVAEHLPDQFAGAGQRLAARALPAAPSLYDDFSGNQLNTEIDVLQTRINRLSQSFGLPVETEVQTSIPSQSGDTK